MSVYTIWWGLPYFPSSFTFKSSNLIHSTFFISPSSLPLREFHLGKFSPSPHSSLLLKELPFILHRVFMPVQIWNFPWHSHQTLDFPGSSALKNPPANEGDAGDSGSMSGSGRTPEGGSGSPLQYSCLGNLMHRGAWWAAVHGFTKSWAQLSN